MTDAGTVTMSARELNRLEVLGRVIERRWTQRQAAEQLGLGERQVRRLCRALERQGAAGLVSRKRGRPSNRTLPASVRDHALSLVRARYADFGPTLAREKLAEHHAVALSTETLRQWMIDTGLWVPRAQRPRRAHQPRSTPRFARSTELCPSYAIAFAFSSSSRRLCSSAAHLDAGRRRQMQRTAAHSSAAAHSAGARAIASTRRSRRLHPPMQPQAAPSGAARPNIAAIIAGAR